MSYQVLARKWRPRNFATLVGQEHVVRALTHALTEKRLHHAYLFTGTRGVGKTTIARILAKSLNCESGVTASPCGVCSTCQEIDAGRYVDLLEVDAATNTRVDEMRQLLENAVYAPTRGRYKVYVIDEVHMLSNAAFNAMLKTLEEPPEHVKFILATTDPQKIPVTVLSRCLQFNLKQMPIGSICAHLIRILEAEGVPYENPALQLIARSAAGSMRDALSLLDQAIAHGAGKIVEAQVRDMLGTVDLDYLFDLLEALVRQDAGGMLSIADEMAGRSLAFSSALLELGWLLTRIQVAQFAAETVSDELPERERIQRLAAAFSPEFVQLAYQIVVQGRQELGLAPDEQAGFVMTLLRLHAFRPGGDETVLSASRASSMTTPKEAPAVANTPPSAAVTAALLCSEVKARPAAVHPATVDWQALIAGLKLNGMARELAQHCELRELNTASCLLRLSPSHRHLQMKPAPERLQQALVEHFGRELSLRIELAENESDTPAITAQRERKEKQDAAIAAIEQDPFVRDVIEQFDASLIETTIKPVN
ncbi:MAG: DNA polymerase III subunit gamma/tau [Sphingomonadales bacterium]|nr:DNA polymerase III subunit gamma/tau [Sphingomonadales bacterium]